MTTREDHQPLRFEGQTSARDNARLQAAENKRARRAAKEPISGLTWAQVEANRQAHFDTKQAGKPASKKRQKPPTPKGDWLLEALQDRAQQKSPTPFVKTPRASYAKRSPEENLLRIKKAQDKRSRKTPQ